MKRLATAVVFSILTSTALAQTPVSDPLPSDAQDRGRPSSSEPTPKARILEKLDQKAYRDAIRIIGTWESELARRPSPAVFESGRFHDPALGITFKVPGEWQKIDSSRAEAAALLRTLGLSIALMLNNEASGEHFIFLSNDPRQIARAAGALTLDTVDWNDKDLMDFVHQSTAQMGGTFQSHEFTKLAGGTRALIAEIIGPGEQFVAQLAVFADRDRMHLLQLYSKNNEPATAGERLRQILETVRLQKRLEGSRLYPDIVRNARNSRQPTTILNAVEQLILAGEVELAAAELALLRALIAAAIPHPEITGSTARWTPYGISVESPDPDVWSLELVREHLGAGIFLAEGGAEEGIGITVIDFLVIAPALASLLARQPQDARMLREAARSISKALGKEIESQEYTTLHGQLAYQVTSETGADGQKARFLLQTRAGYVIGIFLLADAERFTQQIERYEAIVKGKWVQLGR